jgi:hypothetical protein
MRRTFAASIIAACIFFVFSTSSFACVVTNTNPCSWPGGPFGGAGLGSLMTGSQAKAVKPRAKKPRAVKRQARPAATAKRDPAPRSCLAAPAAALLSGLEAECGRKHIVKTCCTGCRMTLTPSRASLHSKRLAFDTEEASAAAKACTVAYLARQKKGTVITYGWLPKVVHADVGSFVKRIHAGKSDSGASWPIARITPEYKSPVRDISPEPVKNDGKIELASADPSAMLDESKPSAPTFLPKIDAEARRIVSISGEPIDPKPSGPLLGPVTEISGAAKAYGQPKNMMWAFGKIESSLNCRARTGRYKGLFQLSDFLFVRYGNGNIYNCRDNAYAAAKKFAVESRLFEEVVGREPTHFDLYLIHQQGWQGAAMHAAYPERLAWRNMHDTDEGQMRGETWAKKAIWGNIPAKLKRAFKDVAAVTSRMFMASWEARVNNLSALYASKPPREITVAKKVQVAKVRKRKRVKVAQR